MLGLGDGCSPRLVASGLPSPSPCSPRPPHWVTYVLHVACPPLPPPQHSPHALNVSLMAHPAVCFTSLSGLFSGPLYWNELRAGRGVHVYVLLQLSSVSAQCIFVGGGEWLLKPNKNSRWCLSQVISRAGQDGLGYRWPETASGSTDEVSHTYWYQVVCSPGRDRSSPASALWALGCLHPRLVPWASAWYTSSTWPRDGARLSPSSPPPESVRHRAGGVDSQQQIRIDK